MSPVCAKTSIATLLDEAHMYLTWLCDSCIFIVRISCQMETFY